MGKMLPLIFKNQRLFDERAKSGCLAPETGRGVQKQEKFWLIT